MVCGRGEPVFFIRFSTSRPVSLRGRMYRIWYIQGPETSEILNAHSIYKLSYLTYAHVFTNTRPHDCAITRVQRQRTSPSTQRFPNSKAYIHRVLHNIFIVFFGSLRTNPSKHLGLYRKRMRQFVAAPERDPSQDNQYFSSANGKRPISAVPIVATQTCLISPCKTLATKARKSAWSCKTV